MKIKKRKCQNTFSMARIREKRSAKSENNTFRNIILMIGKPPALKISGHPRMQHCK